MDKRGWIMLVVVGAIVAVVGIELNRLRVSQRLGKPGLKLVDRPVRDPQGNPVGTNSVYLPDKVLTFSSTEEPVQRLVLDMLPKDTTYGQRRYRAPDGFWISTSVVLMGSDRSSIHKPQICMVGQGWTILKTTPVTFRVDRPHAYDLPVMKLDVTKEVQMEDGRKVRYNGVFLYWFVSQDQLTADHWDRQWWMARDLVTRGLLQRWAYITHFAVCPPGLEQVTYERMKNFIVEAVPTFQEVTGKPIAMTDDRSKPLAVVHQ